MDLADERALYVKKYVKSTRTIWIVMLACAVVLLGTAALLTALYTVPAVAGGYEKVTATATGERIEVRTSGRRNRAASNIRVLDVTYTYAGESRIGKVDDVDRRHQPGETFEAYLNTSLDQLALDRPNPVVAVLGSLLGLGLSGLLGWWSIRSRRRSRKAIDDFDPEQAERQFTVTIDGIKNATTAMFQVRRATGVIAEGAGLDLPRDTEVKLDTVIKAAPPNALYTVTINGAVITPGKKKSLALVRGQADERWWVAEVSAAEAAPSRRGRRSSVPG